MTIDELAGKFDQSDWSAQSALIEYNGDRGIVLLNSQVRRHNASGRFIVFWEEGKSPLVRPMTSN